jgi:hypothetical protein
MSPITSNITVGTSLSISVSGTANIQRALAAAPDKASALKMLSSAPSTTPDPKETAVTALAKASDQTRHAVLEALQLYDPKASLVGYKDGQTFRAADGRSIDIIA